jgi:hypothetical protein
MRVAGGKLPDINLTRANISLYATRLLMADWLDSLNIPDRVRNGMLGHTNKEKNSAREYGGKGMFSCEQAGFVMALETPIIRRMRTILVGAKEKADAGILTTIDPLAAESNNAQDIDT